jgi:hypothetical protein
MAVRKKRSPQAVRRGLFRGKRHHQDRHWAAVLPAAIMGELPAFPEDLQRTLCHRVLGGLPGWCDTVCSVAIAIGGIGS